MFLLNKIWTHVKRYLYVKLERFTKLSFLEGTAVKIYRVNMSNLSVVTEEVPEDWKVLGGRGLTSVIVAKEVDPTCHALGSKNKLIFAPGLLTGSMAWLLFL